MLTLIVYVGAVAVLFLFVVMMLNVNYSDLKSGFLNYLPFGGLIGIVLIIEIGLMIGTWKYRDAFIKTSEIKINSNLSNTEAIGNVLYTEYLHYFQISGLILLVAMIGAILLTYRRKDNLKRQDITTQVSRERSESIQLENDADSGDPSFLLQETYNVGDFVQDKTAQNELFDQLDNNVLDFSESNPFGDAGVSA